MNRRTTATEDVADIARDVDRLADYVVTAGYSDGRVSATSVLERLDALRLRLTGIPCQSINTHSQE